MKDDPIQIEMRAGLAIPSPRQRDRRRPRGVHRREVLRALIDEHGDMCSICAKPLGNLALCNVDHVIPISRGGTGAWSNLRPAHIACNTRKGNRVDFAAELT